MYEKVTNIDGSTIQDHRFLTPDDSCGYYGEYTAKAGFSRSETNQLIYNLKKHINSPEKELAYKKQAITTIAKILEKTISFPQYSVFVPVPPSNAKSHPDYDDRLVKILLEYQKANLSVDYRELIIQSDTTRKSHLNDGNRLTPEELIRYYRIDESLIDDMRRCIVIFDDMLTTGSHFKAMQSVLSARFPSQNIFGLFVSRRVLNAQNPEDAFPPASG
jgi:predicted amidophosphoribosyltransferase